MKNDKVYLAHIAESLDKILTYTMNTDDPGFMQNDMMRDAVVRQI